MSTEAVPASGGTGRLRCPSARPDMAEAQVLGVVGRSAAGPRVSYLNAALPVTEGILGAAGPVPPTRVLRIAARCEEARCTHFDGAACRLAERIVQTLAAVTDAMPPCVIHRSCR